MKKMKSYGLILSAVLFYYSFLFLQGCGNGPSASTDNGDNMAVGFAELTTSPEQFVPDTTFSITSIKVLVSNVELYQAYNSEYQTVKADPIVINMTPNVGFQMMGSGVIGNGIYQRIRFQLHQPAADEVVSDNDFKTGSGNSERQSVIIAGTFHGLPFTYKMHSSAIKELVFPTNVELDLNPLSITVQYSSKRWFRNVSNILMDPLDPANSADIDANITTSLNRAFLDSDHNGSPDTN